jgi:hypothetical protein
MWRLSGRIFVDGLPFVGENSMLTFTFVGPDVMSA